MDDTSWRRASRPEPIPFPVEKGHPNPSSGFTIPSRPALPRYNLPLPVTSFVGRKNEILTVVEKILAPQMRLLTLTGPGGIGKTRLALEAAGRVAHRFADGVYFVSLASLRDPEKVLQAIAIVLGLREEGSRSLTDLLKREMRDRQILLVLDNLEHLIAASPEVTELLQLSPGLKLLVTSREALRVQAEHLLPVPSLTTANAKDLANLSQLGQIEAIELFAERARAVKPDFALTEANARAVVELCGDRLEGLPLAIELAASRVTLFPPQELLGKMEQRLKLLAGGPRDVPERLQTMANAIAWSYDLLTEPERKLFQRLTVFAGGWSLDAAQAVCGPGNELGLEVLDGLESLIAKSLVRQEDLEGEARFNLLEILREYGQECLESTGEAELIRSKHASYFLALAGHALPQLYGPGQAAWLQKLEQDHDNFRAVLNWTLETGKAGLGLQLGATLSSFWYMRGHCTEGRAWHERVFAMPDSELDPAICEAMSAAAMLADGQGDHIAAYALANRALAITRECLKAGKISGPIGDQLLCQNLLWTAQTAFVRGDRSSCYPPLEEALTHAQRPGLGPWTKGVMAWALWLKGIVALVDGDLPLARHALGEAFKGQLDAGERMRISMGHWAQGLLALEEGNYAVAESSFWEALSINRELGHKRGQAIQLACLAQAKWSQRDYTDARVFVEQGLRVAREVGANDSILDCLPLSAALALEASDSVRAGRLVGCYEANRERFGGVGEMPIMVAGRERTFAATRAALGDDAFARSMAEGREMNLDDAVEYMLAAVPTAPSPPVLPPSSVSTGILSKREQEVAVLVSQGRSNRDIAAQLVISNRTVETHVSNILSKLGFSSRAQLAFWAGSRQALEPNSGDL